MALTYSYNAPTNSYYVVYNSCTAGAVVIPSTHNDGVNGVKPVGGINDGAFSGCTSITSIVIPNSVTYLGDGAFEGCTNLSTVSIGTGVTGFTLNLFLNCTSLINLTVPSNILIINPEAFYGCLNLTNINIDSNNPNFTSVDGVVFNKNITTLVLYPIGKIGSYSIPNTVTSIGTESFLNCTNLTNITIPDSVTSIGQVAFQGCSALTTINIPNSVTSIAGTAFYNCTGLTRVTIPNTVTSIGQQAFQNCTNLNNITIPKNVTTIGNQVFSDCTSLTRVNFLGNAPTLGTNVFLNTNVNLKVYRYSTKSGWSSTFGGEDVLLIDSPATGIETFGFGANSLGQASVKKTNVGSGRLTLSKFDPRNISNIALWTKQGSLTNILHYTPSYLTFVVNYDGGDIDTLFYYQNNLLYSGDEFGFYIEYNESYGKWYLYDPNDTDIAEAEDLFGPWITYNDLNSFQVDDWDYISLTAGTLEYVWSDVSGGNNHLTTRKSPPNNGITSPTINGLQSKLSTTPFKTTNTINSSLPFTIYIALIDNYTGVATRKILGASNVLYLESTSFSGAYHTFALKYYASGILTTICSFNVFKVLFASFTYAPSILKISSAYQTTSASPVRNVTLSYYNLYSDINKTFGSLSANGTASFNTNSSAGNLYLGNNNFGSPILGSFYLSEALIYNKSLSTEEDGSINRYLQRKYYGKLLS